MSKRHEFEEPTRRSPEREEPLPVFPPREQVPSPQLNLPDLESLLSQDSEEFLKQNRQKGGE